MQPADRADDAGGDQFQSSPVPEDGCNYATSRGSNCWLMFQSSPVPEDGCNESADHPLGFLPLFQSSPVPEDGCNQNGSARRIC